MRILCDSSETNMSDDDRMTNKDTMHSLKIYCVNSVTVTMRVTVTHGRDICCI
jgi:hypothetical protein